MTHPFPTRRSSDLQQTIFIADSTVNERPSAEMLADIAERTAQVARRMGHEPRVAFLSYSTFGNPAGSWLGNIRDAVHIQIGRATSELQSLMRISYAVFCLKKKKKTYIIDTN